MEKKKQNTPVLTADLMKWEIEEITNWKQGKQSTTTKQQLEEATEGGLRAVKGRWKLITGREEMNKEVEEIMKQRVTTIRQEQVTGRTT